MRLAPLLILAASAAADGKHNSSKKRDKSLTNEAKHKKKQVRQQKKKKREEDAALKLKDPLAGLTKEIEDLAKLEDELAEKITPENGASESKSTAIPDVTFEVADEKIESTKDCTQEMCQYELESDFLLEYKVNVPADTTVEDCAGCSLSVKLTYEGTAWVAFALSTHGEMIGSEAVIGHPLMEGTEPGKYYLGGKYDGGIQPMEDEKQTLINSSISFENGQSILQFEKLMKEDGEIEITTGLNTFLWAHGEDNSLSTYHGNNRSPFQLNLLGVGEENEAASSAANSEVKETSADSIQASSETEDVSDLPPCPPAYDQSHKYTAGDQVEVGNFIWECREFPYDMYCNVPDFHPSLTEENPNAEDLWLNAWSKSLGACAKPPGSPTSNPSDEQISAPVTAPTAKTTFSPSEIILTALPTQSPVADNDGGLPFPVPELRFIEWKELGLNEKKTAGKLGYNRYSWNNLEVSDLEEKSFEDLSASEKAGALALGFDQNTWDCFMSHYYNYYWSELEDANVDQHFTTLGWTQHIWDNDGKSPDSDDKSWNELSEEEQLAATSICYTEEAWDWVPLPSW